MSNIINSHRFGIVTPPVFDFETNLLTSWQFENNFFDYTDNKHDVYGSGTVTNNTLGLVGNQVDFQNNIDYLVAADHDDFSFGDGTTDVPFSGATWIKFDTYDEINGVWIISKRDSVDREWELIIYSKTIRVILFDKSTGGKLDIGYDMTFEFALNTWFHIAFTYDGISDIKIYLDGVEKTTVDGSSGSYIAMENTSSSIYIGNRGFSLAAALDGKLDEMKIYRNRVLASNEIAEMYSQEFLGNSVLGAAPVFPALPLSSIVSEWKMQDNVLDTAGINDGVATNITYETSGVGRSAVFNGTSSIIKMVGSASNFNFNAVDFSVSQMFKTIDTSFRLLQNRGQGGLGLFGWQISVGGVGNWGNSLIEAGAGKFIQMDNIPYNEDDNEWHHLVMTWNTTTGTCNIYIDGVLAGTKTNSLLINANLNALDVVFGGSNTDGQLFSGRGDVGRIWDIELNADDILTIATNELTGVDINS